MLYGTSLPFDLCFCDTLQRKDKVNNPPWNTSFLWLLILRCKSCGCKQNVLFPIVICVVVWEKRGIVAESLSQYRQNNKVNRGSEVDFEITIVSDSWIIFLTTLKISTLNNVSTCPLIPYSPYSACISIKHSATIPRFSQTTTHFLILIIHKWDVWLNFELQNSWCR